ncbi:MAG: winged helix-turn-helix domain-containing protein [Deltaproteobacteria bacterium]|jgi:hypothetical protein|nr:winged helix-turn-helix domain-containing protein [Deltaproteobacteria bacterium]
MPKLQAEYNQWAGRITPKSIFCNLLKRHNWRKILPDKKHPKSSPAGQTEFKKQLSKWNWVRLQ